MQATHTEAAKEYARNVGCEYPDRAWILTNYDTWERNPFYSGPAVPHPESEDVDLNGTPPPWTPEPGAELLGFNLRQVGSRAAYDQRRQCTDNW